MNQVILYGIAGAENQYRVIRYFIIDAELVSISNIVYQANMLKIKNPTIEHVYAIDNRRGLRRDYVESYKRNTIESCAIFKDILEREDIMII